MKDNDKQEPGESRHPDPESTQEPQNALPPIRVEELPEHLRHAVERVGWKELTPVQAKAIPYLIQGRDLMVQSRTGTGKTGAFLLSILNQVDTNLAACQALVLTPTRELARQVTADAEELGLPEAGVRTVAVYGGTRYGPQLEAFQKGAHLVIGTPGRVLDHLVRRSLTLDKLRVLVLDEADRMLSMGFWPDMKELKRHLPNRRNSYLFSATYPRTVFALAEQFLREPEFLSLSRDGEYVAATRHIFYEVPRMEKDRAIVRIIEVENPDSAIIFCNTKANVSLVATVLGRFGYDADQLSSDLTQNARDRVLARVYEKKLRFLVATDVAARGIDIERLSHVFLYDFPEDRESYIHRTGRTGRAGEGGTAVSLVDVLERVELKGVARDYGIEMERRALPTDEDVQATVGERTTALLEARLRNLDRLVRERMERMMPLARRLVEAEETEVFAMLLDEYYQAMLPDSFELPDAPKKERDEGRDRSRGGGEEKEPRRDSRPAARSRRSSGRRRRR
ncbi:MAG: DEAD/DEAH box helicase [Candidatus Eisenbacteria bacterium]|nr:DEAD/DEAH box helicase [Candidatus Eisenbacteria bacterium]